MSTSNAAATAVNTAPSQAPVDPFDDPVTSNKMAVRALIPLLITFVLGTLCLQGFNLVFQQVGADVGAPAQASLITAFPSIVLGIVCFIYGSLGDFVSLKKLVTFGLVTLFIGSIFGFVANYFFAANLWTVIIARVLQTAGEQVAGSAFLVVATKYLRNDLKVIFFGLFTAAYQLSASIGVFAAGMLSSIAWQFLFLIPSVTILFLPILLKTLPSKSGNGQKVDAFGFVIFGFATAFLTLFFSYMSWWMLAVSVALFVAFGFYINKASNPFITPAFFKNTRWLRAICLILVFYFMNYALSPIFNAIGTNIYGMTTTQVFPAHRVGVRGRRRRGHLLRHDHRQDRHQGRPRDRVHADVRRLDRRRVLRQLRLRGPDPVGMRVLRRLRHDVLPGGLHRAGHP